jgi:hypothetical protein
MTQDVSELLETAHISIALCTVVVAVENIDKFRHITNAGFWHSTDEWRKEMKFPECVKGASVVPNNVMMVQLLTSYPVNYKEIAAWIKSFE